MISIINLITGVIALATNFLVAMKLGLEFYGQYALVLLVQSLISVMSDMGFSNVLVQRDQLSKKISVIIESVAIIFCGLIGIVFLNVMLSNINIYVFLSFLAWIFLSIKNVTYTYTVQRASEVKAIVEADLIYAIAFIASCSFLIYFTTARFIDLSLEFIIFGQCIALLLRTLYIRRFIDSKIYSSLCSLNNKEYRRAGLQILDRYGRVASNKAEQFVFGMYLQGEILGLVLFVSNISTQVINRLSSPYTRKIISDSRINKKPLVFDSLNESLFKFVSILFFVLFIGAGSFLVGGYYTSYLDSYINLGYENIALLIFLVVIVVARYDVDFVGCALLVNRNYILVPFFNILYFIMVAVSLILFIKVGFAVALIFISCAGLLISFATGKVVGHSVNLYIYKILGIAIMMIFSLAGVIL